MPFIDSKITVKITDAQKEELKTDLGRLIATLNKPESFLMVGIEERVRPVAGRNKAG